MDTRKKLLKIDDDDVKVAKNPCFLITIFNVALEYSGWFGFQNFGYLGGNATLSDDSFHFFPNPDGI